MKKLTLLLVISIYCFAASAQEIVLTFNAADPEKTIDSIKVTNVESGNSATVIGETTVDLQTLLTSVNGIQNRESELTVYPNPFNENATLEYSINEADEVTVLLTNSLGQTVATKKINLNPGMQRFTVSAANTGIYYISIRSSEGQKSSKIIALSKGNQGNKIDYIGFENIANHKKSALVEAETLIHIELSSGNDKTIIADTPAESKTYEVEFYKCEDADNMNYRIVKIGEQWWMAENLAYLPKVSQSAYDSLTEPKYYVYGFDGTDLIEAKQLTNYKTYSVLYNWSAAMNGASSSGAKPSGVQGICPEGWHLPSNNEWTVFSDHLINNGYGFDYKYDIAKSMASCNEWMTSSLPGSPGDEPKYNNKTGYSALPGGYRNQDGDFKSVGEKGFWWSSTQFNTNTAWTRDMNNSDVYLNNYSYNKQYCFSIRCVKD